MRKLFNYLEAMGRIAKISFDMSLARGLDYYTGMIYEIVLKDKAMEVGSISGGGRYDDLIGMFCNHQIPAVGGSIGIERVFAILESKYKDKYRANECEVLVATIGKVDPAEKLKLLSKLWQTDIKAETLYLEKAKPDKQIAHAFDNKIPLILWLGESELKEDTVKLKILYKYEEVKLKLSSISEDIKPFIESMRRDEQEGKIILENDKKK